MQKNIVSIFALSDEAIENLKRRSIRLEVINAMKSGDFSKSSDDEIQAYREAFALHVGGISIPESLKDEVVAAIDAELAKRKNASK